MHFGHHPAAGGREEGRAPVEAARSLAEGFHVDGTGPAKLVAYDTSSG
jgi:hypothetical protein